MSSHLAWVTAVVCWATIAGCRTPRANGLPGPAAPQTGCVLVAPPSRPPDTVTIAAAQPIDPTHAPEPRNGVEQLLFDQFYEPLVRFDCTGTPRAAAAEQWRADTTGQRWTVTLRDGARFWGGEPVTAALVVAGWDESAVRRLGIETAAATGDRQITVTLVAPSTTVPRLLGDPVLAVHRRQAGGNWPEGSGRYRPMAGGVSGTVYAVPDGAAGTRRPVVTFRQWAGDDPRDALDGGADLIVTDDPAALAYAATLAGFDTMPLAWDRVYAVVSLVSPRLDDETRAGLARDAVAAEARPARPPYWWSDGRCPAAEGAPAAVRAPGRIAYPQGDRIAQALAERLVALGTVGERMVAAGLAAGAFPASLRGGRETAHVVPLSRRPPAACGEAPSWPATARVVPLIETRAHAIVRRGTMGLSTDLDGELRLEWP